MAACYSSIKQSIKHNKLKSGAEGKEEIGNSQEPLRIFYQFCVSYGLKKTYVLFHSITTFTELTTLLYPLF